MLNRRELWVLAKITRYDYTLLGTWQTEKISRKRADWRPRFLPGSSARAMASLQDNTELHRCPGLEGPQAVLCFSLCWPWCLRNAGYRDNRSMQNVVFTAPLHCCPFPRDRSYARMGCFGFVLSWSTTMQTAPQLLVCRRALRTFCTENCTLCRSASISNINQKPK